jgi:hypothetical protein
LLLHDEDLIRRRRSGCLHFDNLVRWWRRGLFANVADSGRRRWRRVHFDDLVGRRRRRLLHDEYSIGRRRRWRLHLNDLGRTGRWLWLHDEYFVWRRWWRSLHVYDLRCRSRRRPWQIYNLRRRGMGWLVYYKLLRLLWRHFDYSWREWRRTF